MKATWLPRKLIYGGHPRMVATCGCNDTGSCLDTRWSLRIGNQYKKIPFWLSKVLRLGT